MNLLDEEKKTIVCENPDEINEVMELKTLVFGKNDSGKSTLISNFLVNQFFYIYLKRIYQKGISKDLRPFADREIRDVIFMSFSFNFS